MINNLNEKVNLKDRSNDKNVKMRYNSERKSNIK